MKAMAIAVEGMPDEARGIARPLEPKLQAALSRSYWQISNEVTRPTETSTVVARKTTRGLLALEAGEGEDSDYRVIGEDGKVIGSVPADAVSSDVADIDSAGKIVITGSSSGWITVSTTAGKKTSSFKAYDSSVRWLRSNNQGTSIIAFSADDAGADIWQLDGTKVASVPSVRGLNTAVFSSDGRQVVTADNEKAAVWSLEGKEIFAVPITDSVGSASSANISSDGRHLAVGMSDGTIEIWSVGGTRVSTLRGHKGYVSWVEFSGDGSRLLSHDAQEGMTKVWDVEKQITLGSHKVSPDAFFSSRFAPDGRGVVMSNGPNIWYPERTDIRRHTLFNAEDVDLSSDGTLSSGGESYGRIQLYDPSGEVSGILIGHEDRVWSTSFSSEGKLLTTAADSTARIWTSGKAQVLSGHTDNVWNGVFSTSGKLALTSSSDGSSRLWTSEGKLIAVLKGEDYPVGRPLGNIDTDQWIFSYKAGKNWHSGVISADEKLIVTVSGDNTFRLWNTNGTFIRSFGDLGSRVWDAAISSTGNIIAAGLGDGTVLLFGLDGKLIRKLEIPALPNQQGGFPVWRVKFNEAGTRLLADTTAAAYVWDIDGRLMTKVPPMWSGRLEADFNSDGTIIVTADGEVIRGWDLEGNLLLTFNSEAEHIRYLPNGQILGYSEGAALILPEPLLGQELVQAAKRKLVYCLSPAERRSAFLPPFVKSNPVVALCGSEVDYPSRPQP